MKLESKKTKLNIKQLTAVEIMAANPSISNKELANKVGLNIQTINKWVNSVPFIERYYDRFMEIFGKYLPSILMAQVIEAQKGSTPAAIFLMKHAGKFEDTLTIKMQSPFEQHLKYKDIENAELVEEDAKDIGNSFNLPKHLELPNRDPLNDKPRTKLIKQNKDLKKSYKKAKKLQGRSERHSWRKRARSVGISMLPTGRPKKIVYRKWQEDIIKAETLVAQGLAQEKQKSS